MFISLKLKLDLKFNSQIKFLKAIFYNMMQFYKKK